MIINYEKKAIPELIGQLFIAARTAPKARGKDSIVTAVIETEEEKFLLINEMKKMHSELGRQSFLRDANNLEHCDAILLLGVRSESVGLDCLSCGKKCEQLTKDYKISTTHFNGPICSFKTMDLGIAIGSVCKKASDLNLDNRLMYSAGLAAKRLNLINVDQCIALPISVSGKNIFFDR